MLETISYCPILLTRVAEIKALSQLPVASKVRTFPILVARPWPNAKALAKTWEKLDEAFSNLPFGLDLDVLRNSPRAGSEASLDFSLLFDGRDGFANYYSKVAEFQRAVPVVRIVGTEAPDLANQIRHINDLERGAILRLSYGAAQPAMDILRRLKAEVDDVVVVVDVGWSRDLLGRELWASQIIEQIAEISTEIEIVISGSSFPDSFTGIGARGEIRVEERALFANLTRGFNEISLTYSDWGSTRPPSDPMPMTNKPRLDLPLSREWVCFRQEGEEDYQDIAVRMMSDPLWPRDLNIWGTYMVAATAEDTPGAIKSAATAAASRINIHLHRQAQFDQPHAVGDGDEPYTDD